MRHASPHARALALCGIPNRRQPALAIAVRIVVRYILSDISKRAQR
jgi:hypothetical protein